MLSSVFDEKSIVILGLKGTIGDRGQVFPLDTSKHDPEFDEFDIYGIYFFISV